MSCALVPDQNSPRIYLVSPSTLHSICIAAWIDAILSGGKDKGCLTFENKPYCEQRGLPSKAEWTYDWTCAIFESIQAREMSS